ncbi:hypothetical protein [Paracholeplasma manati]|uniref:Uncharacterized protein n=1 Tax=Paracholeplasma manati TaxID=591373 RepID=A0ABT2Y598_9MOLU|nr:hypothetical protein [Paracholeplasma manati]MCV2231924.1 hypothetical protein [Paracholeplasma manati]MDG0888923.1 hypothetical protein [Paracholeplasma manati]
MSKITVLRNKCTNTINDEILLSIDNKKIDDINDITIDNGLHRFEISQFHFYNNKFFFFAALLTLFDLLINTVDAGYLPRRWGKYAKLEFELNVTDDVTLSIEMKRVRKNIICDQYFFETNNLCGFNVVTYEERSIFTVLGAITFWVTICTLLTFIVLICF